MIISITARQHGFGRSFYKWVSGLTKIEQHLVKAGALVLFDCGRGSSNGKSGTTLRKVIYKCGKYLPRVPAKDEIAFL